MKGAFSDICMYDEVQKSHTQDIQNLVPRDDCLMGFNIPIEKKLRSQKKTKTAKNRSMLMIISNMFDMVR